MAKRTAIVLDVSRLLSRTKRGSPTGIDRVELNAAEELLESGQEAYFFATRGPRSWFIPREEVAALVRTFAQRWALGSETGRLAAAKVFRFVGLDAPMPPNPALLPVPKILGPRAVPSVLLTRRVERLLQSPIVDVVYRNFSHHHLDKDGFLIGLKQRWQARVEVFWHDAIPILWPEYSREGDAEKHRRRFEAMVSYADLISVNSRATRDELVMLALQNRKDIPNVAVTPLRTPKVFASRTAKPEPRRPYFICVGTLEPRKNHRMLLEVWRELAQTLGQDTPALVLAGRRGWMNADTFALLDRSPWLKPHVIEAPELPDDTLATLLRSASALLMPSFAEGFGLPVVEAQSLGTPVIASDLAVFREVAQPGYEALPPLAGELWKAKILERLAAPLGAPRDVLHSA